MTNATKASQRDAQHAERLDWLRTHPVLLAALPSAGRTMTLAQEEALDTAIRQMKHVRLYAPTSEPDWGIRCLVSELRGEVIDKSQRYRTADGVGK